MRADMILTLASNLFFRTRPLQTLQGYVRQSLTILSIDSEGGEVYLLNSLADRPVAGVVAHLLA